MASFLSEEIPYKDEKFDVDKLAKSIIQDFKTDICALHKLTAAKIEILLLEYPVYNKLNTRNKTVLLNCLEVLCEAEKPQSPDAPSGMELIIYYILLL